MRTPDRGQDRAVREHAVRTASQVRKQLELLRREPDFPRTAPYAAAIEVDRNLAEADLSRLRLVRREHAAEGDADAREELLGAERLGHVVVGAEVEGGNLVQVR